MFKIGDVVQLRSGGPKMTVMGMDRLATAERQEVVQACWYHWPTMTMTRDTFPPDALEIVAPEAKP